MLAGENVYLRPIVKEDIVFLNKWKNDENTYKYLGGGFMPVSVDIQAKWLDTMMDTTGTDKRYIICNNQNKPIGMIGLYSINWINRTSEVGMFIGDTSSRGKGYGKEAYLLLERFAKEYLNLRKLKWYAVSENSVPINMVTKLGYRKAGELIEERFIKGEYKNVVILEKFI